MRHVIGIIYFALMAVTSTWAQHEALAVRLAEQLGLCSNQKKQAGNFNLDYPCNQCEIKFAPLSPGNAPGQLFFLEVQSPNHCGSGGCTGTVYRQYGKGYQEVNNFFGFFEKTVPRAGSTVPDLVYLHLEYPRHDYDHNGSMDHAAIRVQYRWDNGKTSYELIDILSIEACDKQIPLGPWRKLLLQEYRQASPWVF